ncbi:hypothetical protein B0H10DRAFT_2227816 [Mycena sp. CBHHK59/15]|nr:hypothetical protein B0H10DRAFT_2227816 [Mycena sp. CBHHK59/15]
MSFAATIASLVSLKFIRICPVISSTVNLMWAFDEYMFLSAWVNPAHLGPLDQFPLSVVTGLLNVLTHSDELQAVGALKWYWMAFAFTTAHFFFAPTAIRLLAAIQAGQPDGKPTKSMARWLSMHIFRTAVADLPACLCFIMAAVSAMDVVA